MKQIIIMGFLTVISIAASSQVYKFNAFQSSSTTNFDKLISERDWRNTDMSVEINFDKNQIYIFGNNGKYWNLLTRQESFVNVPDDKYVLHYEGIDGDGVHCQIYMTFFKDSDVEKISTLTMIYSNYKMSFRLKKEV